MEDIKYLKTIEEIRGISDPYRYRILKCFYKAQQPATVKQIADEMGEVPANVHYHVKKMEKVGILKLVYTKEINGIIAKYYEPTARRFDIVGSNEDEADKLLVRNETQKAVSELYDGSKRIFMESMERASEKRDEEKGAVSMEQLYLTPEEAQKFLRYIVDYFDKNSVQSRKKQEDTLEYNCFFSIIAIDEKK